MKEFFKVTDLKKVLEYTSDFPRVKTEDVPLPEATGRVLAADIFSEVDLPDFMRSTMDGYAISASSTFGASEANPAYLTIRGSVSMGESPAFSVGPGEAAKISTGGMLPGGTDSVVMIEHTETIDKTTIEVYRSIAPGQNVMEKGEDISMGAVLVSDGKKLRAQETGLLAAFGQETVRVYKKPVIGIISTGDLVKNAGAEPATFGIVRDDFNDLFEKCTLALEKADMVLISGGSSVGTHDFTIQVLAALPDAQILVHGISISPGKPTILAKSHHHAIWGLPGQVVSAMVVFEVVVKPFIEQISGLSIKQKKEFKLPALLSRNISSSQGRADYIRVRLNEIDGALWAEPILGKSGLINTMVKADGLIEIGVNTEGLDKGTEVEVIPLY